MVMSENEKYYAPLLTVKDYTEEELRQKWQYEYCRQTIFTHDGIRVFFYDNNFDHAFYESSVRNQSKSKKKSKDIISHRRLARMLWIKKVLADPTAEMRVGYDSATKSYSNSKRVSIVKGDYVVVIQIYAENKAKFITAYVADNSIDKIKKSPEWGK